MEAKVRGQASIQEAEEEAVREDSAGGREVRNLESRPKMPEQSLLEQQAALGRKCLLLSRRVGANPPVKVVSVSERTAPPSTLRGKAVTKREGFSPNLPQIQLILPPKPLSPLQPHCCLPDAGCHLAARGSMALNLACTLASRGNSTPKDSDVIGPGWGQRRARCFSRFSRLRATQPSDCRSLS